MLMQQAILKSQKDPHPNESALYENMSLVIPAYNEADRIRPTLKDIMGNLGNLKEVIVVTDGNDSTPEVAKSFGPKIRVLEYNKKLGRGGAIIEGFRAASGNVVCFIDADNSAPWNELKRLSQMVDQDNKCVIGSRWMKDSKIDTRESWFKIVSGRVWRYLIFAFLGLNLEDVQCGLKCFDGPTLRSVLDKVTITNRLFDLALLLNIKEKGVRIKEVGIQWSHNKDSRMPYVHIIPIMFLYLFGLRIAHSRFSGIFSKTLKNASAQLNNFH
jgi:glycosyltransferase involved in cell wall biosynthesis